MPALPRPRIRVGGLSQKVYIVTHGKEIKNEKGVFLEASRKYDATADFEDVARELGWSPPGPFGKLGGPGDQPDGTIE